MNLRLARNKDSDQIIKLIRKCFKDYKNCFLDVENDSPELKYIYSYFHKLRGKFWVIEDKNKIIGCMGYLPSKTNEIEIHKLYIDQKFRRKGLAKYLVKKVENIAVKENKSKVFLCLNLFLNFELSSQIERSVTPFFFKYLITDKPDAPSP